MSAKGFSLGASWQASKLVGRSKKTLTKWINAGTFQAYRVGNANKIDCSYLADWLEKREMATK